MIKYLCLLIIIHPILVLNALTLKESVDEVILTHPSIQVRLKNYRAVREDMNIADSEYLPQLDLRSSVGHKELGLISDKVQRDNFGTYENSLILTQNLFNGFGTIHKVNYEKARVVAAAYNYVEKANDIAIEMVDAYLKLMKADELYQNAQDNVASNEDIYAKVYDLYIGGLAARSEVDKIQSSLALSRSNLSVRRNNRFDAIFKFRRILGRKVEVETLVKPVLDVKVPESLSRASQYAINHNPALMVSRFNIKGAQELQQQRKKNYYPTLDAEISQNYNDNFDNFTGQDDRFQAMLVLRWNLYRGGADSAEVQKNISKINQEIDLQREIKREVIEGLQLSWAGYRMLEIQLNDLYKFQSFSYSTLNLYEDEYALGQRSLLDLLAAQNDFFDARSQIISAEYDQIFAKYRILDAMGVMVSAVSGNDVKYYEKVGLVNDKDGAEILDELPVHLDADNDTIVDNQDLCDNSLPTDTVMPNGCRQIIGDIDGDGVKDDVDACPRTPLGLDVDRRGCPKSFELDLNFHRLSDEVVPKSKLQVQQFARFLKENYLYNALIIGHTDGVGTKEENLDLSLRRAKQVKKLLILYGIDEVRLHADGHGDSEPIADNSTVEGRALNRRTEIKLNFIKEGE